MNCLNCGAPLELADGRTILKCCFCQSLRSLISPTDDGDRLVLLNRPSGMDCPRCDQELGEAAIDGYPARVCSECRGILLEDRVFAHVSRERRAAYTGPEQQPQPIDAESLQQFADCPSCHERMDVHPNCGPGLAVIDSCNRCHLVWLDNSEMTSIERTPGRR